MIELDSNRDTVFKDPTRRSPFVFDSRVAAVFEDMLNRSVPLYSEIIHMLTEQAALYLQPNDHLLDLGCSTGTLIESISKKTAELPLSFTGVDVSAPMIARAKNEIAVSENHHADWLVQDLAKGASFPTAKVIVMNLVLQFIDPACRQDILRKVYEALAEGGCFFILEKCDVSLALKRHYETHYYNFKRRNGYDEDEIKNKAASLEGVLRPLQYDENVALLNNAGFSVVDSFFRWYNFTGFLAIK